MRISIFLFIIFIIFFSFMIYPFFPGDYDPAGNSFSTFIQFYSGAGLITCIPALLWFYQNRKIVNSASSEQAAFQRYLLTARIYILTSIIAIALALFITMFMSRIISFILTLSFIYLVILVFKKLARMKPDQRPPSVLPLALALLPVSLIVFQLLISKPLTNWSRNTAIKNSTGLIEEIKIYKFKYGKYPITLNTINKDYKTGINSIEKYYYTYADTSYNIYFEQTRFFFHRFGKRELVVYNPQDNHLMVSHVVWHMLFEPGQLRNNQGWYSSSATGIQHWKSFFFD